MKKQEVAIAIVVRCQNCKWSGNIENLLIECNNIQVNPHNYKMGIWERKCNYYTPKSYGDKI
jgi:hypothetical protein